MTNSLSTPELVAAIDQLSKSMKAMADAITSALTQKTVTEDVPDQKPVKKSKTVKEEAGKDSASGSSQDSEVVTIEQVRAVLAEKSQSGLTSKVKELLGNFGAEKLSAVDPSKYADLYKAAQAL